MKLSLHWLTLSLRSILRFWIEYRSADSLIYAVTIHICWTWNILIHLSYLAHFTLLISSVVIVVYRNSLQTATGFRHELFTMPRFKALKGNLEALLLFWTNPCTSPANWYGRNVITCKRSSCFALGLHNTNDWYEPTEATEVAPAVFPFHVGNQTLLLRPFHLNHASRKTILCEVTGGQLMRKNVPSITCFKFLKPSSSLFITILKMQELSLLSYFDNLF